MSDYHFERRSMDDAIDDAVRDMIRRDPRPGLRRRVLAKIGAPVRSASTRWLIAPAGVLTGVLLAGVLFNRNTPGVPMTTATPSVAAQPAPGLSLPPAREGRNTAAQETPPRGVVRHGSTAASRAPARTAGIFGAPTGRASAASVSAPVEPQDLAPSDAGGALPGVTFESAPPELVVPALQIQPLQLPALASRR
jgi:hypothetical protein